MSHVFLEQNPTEPCFIWSFGRNVVFITASDHAQIEREFGPQGGTLKALV